MPAAGNVEASVTVSALPAPENGVAVARAAWLPLTVVLEPVPTRTPKSAAVGAVGLSPSPKLTLTVAPVMSTVAAGAAGDVVS